MLVIVILLRSAQGALLSVEVSYLPGLLGVGVGVSAGLLLRHGQGRGGQTVGMIRWDAARGLRTRRTRPASPECGSGERNGAAGPPREQAPQ